MNTFKRIAFIFALVASAAFAQQTCPVGTVGITSAGKTIVNQLPSYGFCLNTTTGAIVTNGTIKTSVTASACGGLAVLVAGTKTVATTCPIAATDLVFISRQAPNASTAIGTLGVGTITNGTSFVINSYTAGAATVATGDLSTVSWMVVHTF